MGGDFLGEFKDDIGRDPEVLSAVHGNESGIDFLSVNLRALEILFDNGVIFRRRISQDGFIPITVEGLEGHGKIHLHLSATYDVCRSPGKLLSGLLGGDPESSG